MYIKINNKGQTLVEFAIIISVLMLVILGIMQFAIIYSLRYIVQYAAYTACRVGIVNYTDEGKFDMEKIRLTAGIAISPVAKKLSRGYTVPSGIVELLYDKDRISGAMSMTEIISPDENTSINLSRIKRGEKPPELTVKVVYQYRPIFPFIGKLFAEQEDSSFMPISGTATMPVEIGPPFTPTRESFGQ